MGVIFEGEILVQPKPFQSTRFGKGRAYSDPKKRLYMHNIRLMTAIKAQHLLIKGVSGKPIRLTTKFIFKRPKSNKSIHHVTRPDIDNLLKPVKDSLIGVLWKDDSQICEYGHGTGKFYALDGSPERIYLKVEEL